MIIDHTHHLYVDRWQHTGVNKFNGAYYYSREIVKNIIPNVKTDRNWITVNIPVNNVVPQFDYVGCSHSIVFIHNNLHPENYEWLKKYDDLVLVCGIPETVEKVSHLGKAIYLPLSVDVDYVRQFSKPKRKEVAFVGRPSKRGGYDFPDGTVYLEGMPREELLSAMAEFRDVFTVGRTAVEARILRCNVLAYDRRFPDPDRWKILDNLDAAKILQKKLDAI